MKAPIATSSHQEEIKKLKCSRDSGSCEKTATKTTTFGRIMSKGSQHNRKRLNIEVQTDSCSSDSSVEIAAVDSKDEYMTAKDAESICYSASSDRSIRSQGDHNDNDECGDGTGSLSEIVDHNWTIETFFSSSGILSFKLRMQGGASMILYVDEVLFTLRAITDSSEEIFKVIGSSGDVAFLTDKEVVDYVSWLVEAFSHHATRQAEQRRTTKRRKQLSRNSVMQDETRTKRKTAHHRKQGHELQHEAVKSSDAPSLNSTKLDRRLKPTSLHSMFRFVSGRRQRSLVKAS